jgi:hypothetical protein
MSLCIVRKLEGIGFHPPGRLIAIDGRYFRTYEYSDGVVQVRETNNGGVWEGPWVIEGNMHNFDKALAKLEEMFARESDHG